MPSVRDVKKSKNIHIYYIYSTRFNSRAKNNFNNRTIGIQSRTILQTQQKKLSIKYCETQLTQPQSELPNN